MSNRKAFEGIREATQFKAAGDEPLNAKIELRLTQTMKTQLKAIPGWQNKARSALLELIKNHSQDEPSD
ncbi:hypothetical protein FNW02_35590 [Komarekiella sp. 'clone 1']|uniref:Uncharacterized protein n=1 Tax=Komarekiella delphini-convector SJRDD-AB1 TaxID=2593771 RepID=A0AA40VV76_9NOST|nr:hypothetical protein [Komarekiella delphini-convector]MBD6620912.1 hypothetical protein [Komarekiella delphini-convector SJRDD-AB1]